MDNIYLYGAGETTSRLLEVNAINEMINAIIDKDMSKEGRYIGGVKIINSKEIPFLPANSKIIINTKKYNDEIRKEIESLNSHLDIISLSDILTSLLPTYYCNVCNHKIPFFIGAGLEIKTKYKIVGNGYRLGQCPICWSYDRERWMMYVIQNYTNLFKNPCRILHFAPELNIEKMIQNYSFIDYVTADIVDGRADKVIDITNIDLEDNSFDYILVNHVLEHIPDECKAMNEIKRCLKPNGVLILSVPYSMDVMTIEINKKMTVEDRLYYFGQEDHVRLYGKDYISRFENYGFEIDVYRPVDYLSEKSIEELGIIAQDSVMLCKK